MGNRGIGPCHSRDPDRLVAVRETIAVEAVGRSIAEQVATPSDFELVTLALGQAARELQAPGCRGLDVLVGELPVRGTIEEVDLGSIDLASRGRKEWARGSRTCS